MKTLISIFLSFLFSFSLWAEDLAESNILGLWLVGTKDGIVKIYKKDNKYVGDLVWLLPRNKKLAMEDVVDEFNPDDKLKTRKLLGIKMLKGFDYKDNEWKNGSIYDAYSGTTYSAKMKLKSKNVLILRGYVGIPLFGRSDEWKRVQSIPK